MKTVLVFPPQFEPFQPYLSLAALSASLREFGRDVDICDLNLPYFEWILREGYLERTLQQRHPKRVFHSFQEKRSNTILERGEFVLHHIGDALGVLKGEYFNDFLRYQWAINILSTALEVVSWHFHPSWISFYGAQVGENNYCGANIATAVKDPEQNLFFEYMEQVGLPTVASHKPDVVGFSLVVHDQLVAALTLSTMLRRRFPHLTIAAGGPLVSRLGFEIAQDLNLSKSFDAYFLGEGEDSLCEWLDAIISGHNEERVAGVLVSGKEKFFQKRPQGCSANKALPDFTGLPLDRYFSPKLVLPYLNSRGCYWGKCAFCCHHFPYDTYVSARAEEVAFQLQSLSLRYKTPYFAFADETISTNSLSDLAMAFTNRGLDLLWFTFARMEEGFTPELCARLYGAGCRTLMFGFESSSQRVLDLMGKGTQMQDVPRILHACKKSGIAVRLDTMIGFPTETKDESEATLSFLLGHSALIDNPFCITPLSKFELQRDSPIVNRPGQFSVSVGNPLRGNLDYQLKYEVCSGMTSIDAQSAYIRYRDIIASNFKAHKLMPDNKTHSFLMKCFSDCGTITREIPPITKHADLDTIVAKIPDWVVFRISPSSGSANHILLNCLTGMEIEISSPIAYALHRLDGHTLIKDAIMAAFLPFNKNGYACWFQARSVIEFLLEERFLDPIHSASMPNNGTYPAQRNST